MFYWNPEVFRHKDDINDVPVILGQDEYCTFGQVIAQPVIRIWKLCIAWGNAKRSWVECFEQIN